MRLHSLSFCGLAFFAGGCSLALKYDECTSDSDCGSDLFCTQDHACVSSIPAERICPADSIEGADPDPARYETVTVGALFRLSGASSAKDKERLNGVRLALEEIN